MPSISKFVERMKYWCDEGNLGYDQGDRWDFWEGGEVDCSSLVISVLEECGFDTGDATYTGNMSSELCKHGWKRVSNDGDPEVGAILLNDRNHVAVYIGGGRLAQASRGEAGHRISGGRAGDQDGYETNTRSYYNYPWNCYLVYRGDDSDDDSEESEEDSEYGPFYNLDREDRIMAAQRYIGAEVDGIVGRETKTKCIMTLQKAINYELDADLDVDGIYGPQSQAWTPGIERGRQGKCVYALQATLVCDGYARCGLDGIFGKGTHENVVDFQSHNDLYIDGIAGEATFASLFDDLY